MEKEDARKQSNAVLHERRKQIIRLHRQGLLAPEIAARVGVNRNTAYNAIVLYKTGGWAALVPKTRGAKLGTGLRLTEAQSSAIRKLIIDHRPEQLKMEFALWSREAVSLLIEQQFAIKLPVRTMGGYLKRWGFTPQKPIKRAYEQKPAVVQQWLEESYPKIEAAAKASGGEIHWADETAVMNNDVRGRSFAPKGKTPITKTIGGTYARLSMISSVSNHGRCQWMIIDKSFNADKFIEFMGALVKDSTRKIYLIVDNLKVHHSKLARAWVEANHDKIELHYLPPYSPELNPDERLNADLKQRMRARVALRNKEALEQATVVHMNNIKDNPERVKSYFQDPYTRYAAPK